MTDTVATDEIAAGRGMRYRPEIDGLRAIAVAAVVAFHLHPNALPGGFLGVDVFFVISGYLIFGIIARQLRTGTFSLREFWLRRLRRIFPALLAMLFAVTTATWLIGFRGDHPEVGRQVSAALLCVANVWFYRQVGDYWGTAAEASPVLHTWSLSLEEQFYLLLPPLMCLGTSIRARFASPKYLKYLNRLTLRRLIIAVISVSIAFQFYCIEYHREAAFYLLPCRVWELLTGALLATNATSPATNAKVARYRPWINAIGLVIVAIALTTQSDLWGSLVVVAGTYLFLFGGTDQRDGAVSLSYRFLSTGPLTYVGRISYSLYLWHWPIIVFGNAIVKPYSTWVPPWLILLAISFAVATLSYYFIEQPARRSLAAPRRSGALGGFASPRSSGASHSRTVTISMAAMSITTALFAIWLIVSSRYYDIDAFGPAVWKGLAYDCNPTAYSSAGLGDDFLYGIEIEDSKVVDDAYRHGGIIIGEGLPEIVLLGDSHSLMWADTIASIARQRGWTLSVQAMAGVPPTFSVPPSVHTDTDQLPAEYYHQFDLARIATIRSWQPQVVILAGRWDGINLTDGGSTASMMAFLTQHVRNVVIMEQPPLADYGHRNSMQHLRYLGLTPSIETDLWVDCIDSSATTKARRTESILRRQHPNAVVLRTDDIYRSGQRLRMTRRTQSIYLDDDHLLQAGAELATDRIRDTLDRVMAN